MQMAEQTCEDCEIESTKTDQKATRRKKKKKKQHSLDHLKEHVSNLMTTFEEHGFFIPLPESMSEKGKVWSSRIYGADKKRQRKNAERQFLEDRIDQLELCLNETHGLSVWW